MGKHKPPKPAPAATTVDFGQIYTVKGRWLPDGSIQGATFDFTIGDMQVCGVGVIIDDHGISHAGTFFRGTISAAEICVPDGFYVDASATSKPYDPYPPVPGNKRIGDPMTVSGPAIQLDQHYNSTLTETVVQDLGNCVLVGHDYLPAGNFLNPDFEYWLVRQELGGLEYAVRVNP